MEDWNNQLHTRMPLKRNSHEATTLWRSSWSSLSSLLWSSLFWVSSMWLLFNLCLNSPLVVVHFPQFGLMSEFCKLFVLETNYCCQFLALTIFFQFAVLAAVRFISRSILRFYVLVRIVVKNKTLIYLST